jgi:trans-aconitate methyltransferase
MLATPMHEHANHDLLRLVPDGVKRVVEVGCSSGATGAAFLRDHPGCEYIGIEVVPEYAEAARARLSEVRLADIERMDSGDFASLAPADCWIFGDVLEHLYDPWQTLRSLGPSLAPAACVVACIPNAQHWSVQARLAAGAFEYEAQGLLDRTHIRFFTRRTIMELFGSTGYHVEAIGSRIVSEEPQRARALPAIRALAAVLGEAPDVAERDATPIQYVVRARRAARSDT